MAARLSNDQAEAIADEVTAGDIVVGLREAKGDQVQAGVVAMHRAASRLGLVNGSDPMAVADLLSPSQYAWIGRRLNGEEVGPLGKSGTDKPNSAASGE